MTALRRILFVAAFAALAALAALIWPETRDMSADMLEGADLRAAGFVLSDVQITGLNRTVRSAVIALIDADAGTPILNLDLSELKTRIEGLPWVDRAEVKRNLPSGLDIHITERDGFALWQKDGVLHLVDRYGDIITGAILAEFSDLPLLVGGGARQTGPEFLTYLFSTSDLASRIQSLVRISDRRWDLVFDNGLRLKLPAPGVDDADRRAWATFQGLQRDKQILERAIEVLDMRVEDRLVLRLSPDAKARMHGAGDET